MSGYNAADDSLDDDDDLNASDLHPEHASLTSSSSRSREVPLTKKLLPSSASSSSSSGPASIAHNPAAFGSAASGGVPEGLRVQHDDDDPEVQVEVNSDDELPASDESDEKSAEVPQTCSNWLLLYLIGLVVCLACEFLMLLPAFYLKLVIVGLAYGVIWISVASCATHLQVCPGKRRPNSTLVLVLFLATLAAFIGGMGGAYYYKQSWYFDKTDTAYAHVLPHVSPVSGIDFSGAYGTSTTEPVAEPMIAPSFLEFDLDLDAVDQNGASKPLAAFVYQNSVASNTSVVVGVHQAADGTNYCASPIVSTHTEWSDRSPVTPMVYYWAIGKNCCGAPKDGRMWANCKYWGQNLPGLTKMPTDFSAEVYADRFDSNYRAAVDNFLLDSGLGSSHTLTQESYLVTVMTLSDHYGRQTVRRRKAYACLLSAAVGWPLLYAAFLAIEWCLQRWCTGRKARQA